MINSNNCSTCNLQSVKSHGLDLKNFDYLVALAGNPNVGKSTIFNALTGLRQHTGNWPGKTISRAEGAFSYGSKKFKLVDLPGTYSLLAESTDEEIARNFLLFAQPDVTLVVMDAGRLERNLNLTLQIMEITKNVVVSLNLTDEAEKSGIFVNERILERELGLPVIPTVAINKVGIDLLTKTIFDIAEKNITTSPRKINYHSGEISSALKQIRVVLDEEFPELPNKDWIAIRLLENDSRIVSGLKDGSLLRLAELYSKKSIKESVA